jgi:hypothetical protein
MEYLQSRADKLLHVGDADKPFILGIMNVDNVLHFFIAILLQVVGFFGANKEALFLQVFAMLAH